MKIAVAGGTGTVGRQLVDQAREAGHEVLVLSRAAGVDLTSGAGLDLGGVDTVVDVTGINSANSRKAVTFFTTVTGALQTAAARAGVGHLLALSIIGIDRAPYGMYAGKAAQERLLESGSVPWTILRSAQFHELVPQMAGILALGPVRPRLNWRTQPVAADRVAARLLDLATGEPQGRVQDIAGPRVENFSELLPTWHHAQGHKGWMPTLFLPGKLGKAQRDGTLLPGPDALLTGPAFKEWLQDQQS